MTHLYVAENMECFEQEAPALSEKEAALRSVDSYLPEAFYARGENGEWKPFCRLTPDLLAAFEAYWEERDRLQARAGLKLLDLCRMHEVNAARIHSPPAGCSSIKLEEGRRQLEANAALLEKRSVAHADEMRRLDRACQRLRILRDWGEQHFPADLLEAVRSRPQLPMAIFRRPYWTSGKLPWQQANTPRCVAVTNETTAPMPMLACFPGQRLSVCEVIVSPETFRTHASQNQRDDTVCRHLSCL